MSVIRETISVTANRDVVPSGRIVLLNGPSSAGKSSLAAEFVRMRPTPWFNLPVDLVHSIRSRPAALSDQPWDAPRWQEIFRRSRAGYHRLLAGLAAAGNDVIGYHVLNEPWRLKDLLQAVAADIPVLLVHVTARTRDLERRERARGDREPGTARAQIDVVFAHGDCDLQIDTTDISTADAARAVSELVASWPEPTAFDRMKRTHAHDR